jgi:hypothetical protein
MAIIIENNCVDCPQGCIGCGRSHQEIIKCDGYHCDNYAKYCIDGEDYCEECAYKLMSETIKNYTIEELAKLFELSYTRYD